MTRTDHSPCKFSKPSPYPSRVYLVRIGVLVITMVVVVVPDSNTKLRDGNTFTSEDAAKQRSCDIQNNACSDAANSGAGHTLADCQAQQQACLSS